MSLRLALAAVALCIGFAATPAHAKRGVGVINTGDELFEVADFPAEIVAAHPRAKDIKVGYKCSHFGVFWADVWTWDCGLVGFENETTYSDLPSEITSQLATKPEYAFSHAKRGMWNHYGFWGALGLLVAFLLYGKLSASKSEDAADATSA